MARKNEMVITQGPVPEYISSIPKGKQRKLAIERLNHDGWSVQWEKRGQHWSMERESIVKDVT